MDGLWKMQVLYPLPQNLRFADMLIGTVVFFLTHDKGRSSWQKKRPLVPVEFAFAVGLDAVEGVVCRLTQVFEGYAVLRVGCASCAEA